MSAIPTRSLGSAAVITTVVLASLTAGGALGAYLALVTLTTDPAGALHTIGKAAVVVAIGVDVVFIARTARKLHELRRRSR